MHITPQIVDNYRVLRLDVLARIRAYDLSDTSYQALFDSLASLEKLMHSAARQVGEVLTGQIEVQFAKAANVMTDHLTIADLLTLAHKRHQRLSNDIWSSLRKRGAQIKRVSACIVLSDSRRDPVVATKSDRKFVLKVAPKIHELTLAFTTMDILPHEIIVYPGEVLPEMMRQVPYVLIDIPRLDKQIAICDEMGQICFVSQTIKPLDYWTSSSKLALKNDPDIKPVEYDRGGFWLSIVHEALLGEKADISQLSRSVISRAKAKPALTEETIIRWITFFHEKKGRYPTTRDPDVWDKNKKGEWIRVGETWMSINQALQFGGRGLGHLKGTGLGLFAERHGLGIRPQSEARHLSEEKIKKWIMLFKEKTGRYPYLSDKEIWDKDSKGSWIVVPNETWWGIEKALQQGIRGLAHLKGSSLAKFREQHGLGLSFQSKARHLTGERIIEIFRLFHEHAQETTGKGRYFSKLEKILWDKDEKGDWIILAGETGASLEGALRYGVRGLTAFKGLTLSQFRLRHGIGAEMRGARP